MQKGVIIRRVRKRPFAFVTHGRAPGLARLMLPSTCDLARVAKWGPVAGSWSNAIAGSRYPFDAPEKFPP